MSAPGAVHLDSDQIQDLAARGVAFSLVARLLGSDPGPLVDGSTLDELDATLDLLGCEAARSHLARLADIPAREPQALERAWVRWFDQGRVAPYECSNRTTTVAGHTGPLADVAGFYRAMGMKVTGDRPDHVVAELEFASLVALAEAQARRDGEDERAEACAQLARTFVRDHLGVWIEAWALRVLAIEPALPWGPVAAAAASLVAAEAARRNVIPVQTPAAFPAADFGLGEEDALECGDEL